MGAALAGAGPDRLAKLARAAALGAGPSPARGEGPELDLGGGRYGVKVYGPDRMWCGIQLWHRDHGGGWCAGYVGFSLAPRREGITTWRVDGYAPLALYPSIICPTCGLSGWIRDGRWEDL